jgi:hypothetical protein
VVDARIKPPASFVVNGKLQFTASPSMPVGSILTCCYCSYSILPALTLDGIIYSKIIEDSFDGPAFCAYLEVLMMHMNPYPEKHSVLVMDNCAIHHVNEVEEICSERWTFHICKISFC